MNFARMSAFAIAINVFIGLLTLVGIVAIGIRCCLLAKLIGTDFLIHCAFFIYVMLDGSGNFSMISTG